MTIRITCLRLLRRVTRLMCVAAACFVAAGAASAQDAAARGQGTVPGAQMAMEALLLLGVPYRYGGEDPARGLDCSGLVRHVAQSVLGLDLPRTSEAMARIGEAVTRDALQVGDLVFFNTRGRRYSHVGIYVGDGQFVHAPTQRGKVRVETVSASYWERRFNGARRLLPTAPVATTEAPGAGLTDLVPEPPPSTPTYGDPAGGA
jgi:cell wall-associated NlpC family hydrolase